MTVGLKLSQVLQCLPIAVVAHCSSDIEAAPAEVKSAEIDLIQSRTVKLSWWQPESATGEQSQEEMTAELKCSMEASSVCYL